MGRLRKLFLFCIVVLLPGVLIAVGWIASRDRANSDRCRENLKQIAQALHAYHERYQSFPPAYTADARG